MLSQEESYPVGLACKLLGLPCSTFYYQAVESDESELEKSDRGNCGPISDLRHSPCDP
jgi:hypothetical protein